MISETIYIMFTHLYVTRVHDITYSYGGDNSNTDEFYLTWEDQFEAEMNNGQIS